MTASLKVLFVCAHNAVRSRMAEALLGHDGGDRFDVASAGFEPTAANPMAIEAMRRIGIEIDAAPGRSVFELFRAGLNYVISVCDQTRGERCPLFPGMIQRLTWSVVDAGTFAGNDAEKLDKMIELRDSIRARIETWTRELGRKEA